MTTSNDTPQAIPDVETPAQVLADADLAKVWTTMSYQEQAQFLLDKLAPAEVAAIYQPGDIVRDGAGNLWVRLTKNYGWELVFIHNDHTATIPPHNEDDHVRVPVPPRPLTLLVRDGETR